MNTDFTLLNNFIALLLAPLIWMPELAYIIWGFIDPKVSYSTLFGSMFADLARSGMGLFIEAEDLEQDLPMWVAIHWFFAAWNTLGVWTFLYPPLYKYGALLGLALTIFMLVTDLEFVE